MDLLVRLSSYHISVLEGLSDTDQVLGLEWLYFVRQYRDLAIQASPKFKMLHILHADSFRTG